MKNYFTNIPTIGDLSIERILVEDDCPILFTLISKENKRCISICCEIYEEQRWLISPISKIKLIKLLKNEITLREAFITQEDCIIAHWSKENPILRYEIVHNLPECDLPIDEYLENDEVNEYIKFLINN